MVLCAIFVMALVVVVGWSQLSSKMDQWGEENRPRFAQQDNDKLEQMKAQETTQSTWHSGVGGGWAVGSKGII
jgi:Tfp pilus assembly protein PilO